MSKILIKDKDFPVSASIPFLKWVGGKRWLVANHLELFPQNIDRYIEPFLGSGAVYFALGRKDSILSDANEDLIEAYKAVRDCWENVEKHLKKHAKHHCSDYYYTVRESRPVTAATRAARFIYLNRTCFNGIYRVNKQGSFNVPKGSRNNVMLETDDFAQLSAQLKDVKLIASDFEPIITDTKSGDFMFVDPPYTVAHNLNGFLKYNEVIFTWADQIRLRDCLLEAGNRGVRFLLTNADHQSIWDLYHKGFNIRRVERRSSVAGSSRNRKAVTELLIEANF